MRSPDALNPLAVDTITFGEYHDACTAIGQANLATILVAEQWVSEQLALAAPGTRDLRRHTGILKLVRGRRQRLQQAAQQRATQGNRPATIRL